MYPLLADGTCRLIVFDFDNHEEDAEDNLMRVSSKAIAAELLELTFGSWGDDGYSVDTIVI